MTRGWSSEGSCESQRMVHVIVAAAWLTFTQCTAAYKLIIISCLVITNLVSKAMVVRINKPRRMRAANVRNGLFKGGLPKCIKRMPRGGDHSQLVQGRRAACCRCDLSTHQLS